MRARLVGSLVLVALVTLAAAATAAPNLVMSLGGTFGSSDPPQKSGASFKLAALWHVEVLDVGPEFFVDDLGSTVGRITDQHDGTDLGAVNTEHRMSYGVAWRLDAPLVTRGGWNTRAIVSYGYHRVRDDQVGVVQDAISAIGWSAGLGASHKIAPTFALGASVRYQSLNDERQDHYSSASLDLMWLPEAARGTHAARKAPSKSEN